MPLLCLLFFGLAAVAPLSAQMFGLFSAPLTPLTVPDAPFTATQTRERDQTLADGSHVTKLLETAVMYRDSKGRTRTEVYPLNSRSSAMLVFIEDPIAEVRYQLVTSKKIARRFAMPPPPQSAPQPLLYPMPPDVVGVVSSRPILDGAVEGIGLAGNNFKTRSVFLGTQDFEGVEAEGGRITTILEAGAVGNDRELVVVNEQWVSNRLRIVVERTLSDPRHGDTTTKLKNIRLDDLDAALFAPPADYEIQN